MPSTTSCFPGPNRSCAHSSNRLPTCECSLWARTPTPHPAIPSDCRLRRSATCAPCHAHWATSIANSRTTSGLHQPNMPTCRPGSGKASCCSTECSRCVRVMPGHTAEWAGRPSPNRPCAHSPAAADHWSPFCGAGPHRRSLPCWGTFRSSPHPIRRRCQPAAVSSGQSRSAAATRCWRNRAQPPSTGEWTETTALIRPYSA